MAPIVIVNETPAPPSLLGALLVGAGILVATSVATVIAVHLAWWISDRIEGRRS